MTFDLPTILTAVGAVVSVLLWLGSKLINATKATVNLTNEIKGLRKDLNGKMDSAHFERYMERLGYKNPNLDMPAFPSKIKAST